jgi:hypothetical protein
MAATAAVPIGVRTMHNNAPRSLSLEDIVRKVRALRALTTATGFSTNRSVGELLDKLSQEDLIKVGEMFRAEEQNNKQ